MVHTLVTSRLEFLNVITEFQYILFLSMDNPAESEYNKKVLCLELAEMPGT